MLDSVTVGILTNLVSALIFYILGSVSGPRAMRWWRSGRAQGRLERRLSYYSSPEVRQWVMSRHSGVLLSTHAGSIPCITASALMVAIKEPDSRGLLRFEYDRCAYPPQAHLIRERQKAGVPLVDKPTYRIVGIDESHGRLRGLHIGLCSYHQYVTTLGEVEAESFRGRTAVRSLVCPPGATRIAADYLRERAFAPGLYGALVWQEDGEWRIALQLRSESVFVHPQRYSIVPSHIFQPNSTHGGEWLPNTDAAQDCNLWLNFLREYFEELIDPDGERKSESQVYPRWYEFIPALQQLITWHDCGELTFWFLGLGFDAFNLEPLIFSAAVIQHPDFARSRKDFQRNWESEVVRPYALYGGELNDLLASQRLTPGAAATVWRTRQLIESDFQETA